MPPARRPISADPDDYNEAVKAFRERVPLTDDEFDKLTERAQERAFKVSGVAQADLVTEVHEAIERAIRDGTDFDEFAEEVGEKLERAWGGEIPGRLETIFRTNVQTAYSHGRVRMLEHPAVRRARPYLRLDAIVDGATTPECERLDGTVLPADDPFWRTHTPPLHFNCRDTLVPLTVDEAEEEGVADKGELRGVKADEGFGRAPSEDDDFDIDLNGYPAEIGEILGKRVR